LLFLFQVHKKVNLLFGFFLQFRKIAIPEYFFKFYEVSCDGEKDLLRTTRINKENKNLIFDPPVTTSHGAKMVMIFMRQDTIFMVKYFVNESLLDKKENHPSHNKCKRVLLHHKEFRHLCQHKGWPKRRSKIIT